ncbi:cell division protein SepF [Enemella evansiae]|uniref:cell division protein SepF n=1 Tax=Enemella evansiae TaxID=2016499 RepID=UPI000B9717B1|nr:cell division protein SepF [Enemella evansiae]OYN95886.1 cell division protein SepF [Enemella evansiae]
MAGSRLRGAAEWLGLTTSERYDRSYDYDSDVELTENVDTDVDDEVEDSASVHDLQHRRSAQTRVVEPQQRSAAPAARSRTADISRIITVHPRTYNEARTIGEHFRDGVPVIMNLSEMEDADAKRLVDFAAGLIFGLRGTIERVTSKVFLLSPQNVNVTAEDKERIAGGFFNQS